MFRLVRAFCLTLCLLPHPALAGAGPSPFISYTGEPAKPIAAFTAACPALPWLCRDVEDEPLPADLAKFPHLTDDKESYY